MKGYLGPAVLMLTSVAFLTIRGGMGYDLFDTWPLRIAGAIYLAGAVWWVSVAARAKHRLWLHLVLVWAPVIAPGVPFAMATDASRRDDSAGLAVLFYFGPAAVVCLISMIGALAVMLRLTEPRQR